MSRDQERFLEALIRLSASQIEEVFKCLKVKERLKLLDAVRSSEVCELDSVQGCPLCGGETARPSRPG
jgi:hypothetical protein